MEISDAKGFIDLVTQASRRRRDELLNEFDREYAYDHWANIDLPFFHDLSLLFLVAIRHHIERRLLHFAACASGHGNPIEGSEYDRRVEELRAMKNNKKKWEEIDTRLTFSQCKHYKTIEALRHLANSYKHDPLSEPDTELLEHLELDPKLKYARLPESDKLQKGLALFLELPENAGYADITEQFVERARQFLEDVQSRNTLSEVLRVISLGDFAY
jgi:hypothetical protein